MKKILYEDYNHLSSKEIDEIIQPVLQRKDYTREEVSIPSISNYLFGQITLQELVDQFNDEVTLEIQKELEKEYGESKQ